MIPGLSDIFNSSLVASKFSPGTKLGVIITGLLNIVFLIAGFLLFFWMAWGIFEYIFAGGDKGKLEKARSRITWAIVGFVIIILSFTISMYLQQIFPPQATTLKGITPP